MRSSDHGVRRQFFSDYRFDRSSVCARSTTTPYSRRNEIHQKYYQNIIKHPEIVDSDSSLSVSASIVFISSPFPRIYPLPPVARALNDRDVLKFRREGYNATAGEIGRNCIGFFFSSRRQILVSPRSLCPGFALHG